MNVLILNQYALPRGAPGITRHGDLGSVLVELGHNVTIIASGFDYLTRQLDRTKGEEIRRETHSGVDFIWLKTTQYKANDSKRVRSMLAFSFKAFVQSLKLEEKPDLIWASSPHLLTGLAGLLAAAYYRIPLVFEVRDLWPSTLVDLGAIRQGSLLHKILVQLEKTIYERSSRIIAVPPFTYQHLESLGINIDKCIHIPNGIFVEKETHDNQSSYSSLPRELLDFLETQGDRKIILYAGAHGVANNLNNVIEAFDYLRRERLSVYEKIAFVCIGSGQQKEVLIKVAKEKRHSQIYFHPPVDKKVLRLVLSSADILLVHLAEAQVFNYGISPNKLYDYLESSKPVLLSSPSSKNLIDEIGAGMTFLPGKPQDLALVIEAMIAASEEDRTSMGHRGQIYVREHHNLEKLGKKLEVFLLEVVS